MIEDRSGEWHPEPGRRSGVAMYVVSPAHSANRSKPRPITRMTARQRLASLGLAIEYAVSS